MEAGKKSPVAAVVVTYNRLELLKECVEALCGQTHPADLLIVDNASTDGTQEWIRNRMQQENSGRIQGIFLEENTGGAGGYFVGMKWAVEQGYDYIWIMDDDTIPMKDALERLLNGLWSVEARCVSGADKRKMPQKCGFVSSTVLWTDKNPCIMNRQHYVGEPFTVVRGTGNVSADGPAEDIGECQMQQVDSATFVSLLFRREAVEHCGLPLKEYFIWGDDKEYTLRMAKEYFCCHVKDSIVIHKMTANSGSNIVTDEAARVPRYYYAYRNDLCTAKRRGIMEVCIYFAAFVLNMIRVLVGSPGEKGLRLGTMWKGMKDGISFAPRITYVVGEDSGKEDDLGDL